MPMIPLPPRTTFELSISSLNLSAILETPTHFDQVIAALTTMRDLFVEAAPKPLGSPETPLERSPEEIVRELVVERAPVSAGALCTTDVIDAIVAKVIAEPSENYHIDDLVDALWAAQLGTTISALRRTKP